MAIFVRLGNKGQDPELARAHLQDTMDSARAQAANVKVAPAQKRREEIAKKLTPIPADKVLKDHMARVALEDRFREEAAQRRADEQRQHAEAVAIVADPHKPIEERVDAARLAGFDVVFRGPEDKPWRIIFRSPVGQPRFTFMFPKGKRARKQFQDDMNSRISLRPRDERARLG